MKSSPDRQIRRRRDLVSFVIRDDQLVPVRGSTVLRAGDEILALTDPERGPDLAPAFTPSWTPRRRSR